MKIEQLQWYKDYYSKQEGRKCPCSNQTVLCGIFTDNMDKAIRFMSDKDIYRKMERKDSITWFLKSGERWVWTNWNDSNRGCRFYKIAVDAMIDDKLFDTFIMPYSSMYCCSMELI